MRKLYRRPPWQATHDFGDGEVDTVLVNDGTVVDIGNEYVFDIDFKYTVGWIAFDVKAQVASQANGAVGRGYLKIELDGKEIARYRASWPWTRHYIYCKKGIREVKITTHDYNAGDEAQFKYLVAQYFLPVEYIQALERAQPPKDNRKITLIETLSGYNRFQVMGQGGADIEFGVVLQGAENFNDFMTNHIDNYILQTNEGFWGGMLLPQATSVRKLGGDLYIIDCTLHSTSQAGVGH